MCGRKSSGLSGGKALNRGAGAICPWCLQRSSYNLGSFPQSPLAGPPLASRTPCCIWHGLGCKWGHAWISVPAPYHQQCDLWLVADTLCLYFLISEAQ